MTTLTVLVTGVGSTTAQSVLKGLLAQEKYTISIVGTDIHEADEIVGAVFCDTFYNVPPATKPQDYISSLREIIIEEEIELLIPIVDPELAVLAKYRERIPSSCELLLSSQDTVETCNDKYQMAKWMESNGVESPTTIYNPSDDQLESLFESAPSLIAKPRRGVSSRGVYELQSVEDRALLDRIDNPIVQPKIEGKEYTIDVFRTAEKTVAVPRERIDTRSGISYKGRTVSDKRLISKAEEIVNSLDVIGPANLQCFESEDNTLTFFEVNPRFSGSLPLTIEAGLNSPRCALEWAVGDQVSFPNSIREITMCRFWEEAFHSTDGTKIPRHLDR
jgi:carbamoyl-phosphate synthase large subunit